jgi:uncharacterized protein
VKVLIAGGSGSLGRRLADDQTAHGHQVTILTRTLRPHLNHRQIEWDGRTSGAWAVELENAAVINLAGELVDRRPTAKNIELLRRSRVDPTRALVNAAATLANPPTLWLQMSTLAIYGDAGQGVIDELHPVADGPAQMAGVARPWEEAVADAVAGRLVIMRTGIVLDRGTPAFERLVKITKLGLGGRISTGEQWVSWIHVDDFINAVHFLCDHAEIDGVVHVTSPNPVRNRDMMATLRAALHRPLSLPTPKPLVHIGAMFMRTDPALALTGRRCIPSRLTSAGFEFKHATFQPAVGNLLTPMTAQSRD